MSTTQAVSPLRTWTRQLATRAEGVLPAKVWFLSAAVGVLTGYGVLGFTIAIEAITTFAYGEGTSLLAQGARDLSAWRAFMVPAIGGLIVSFLLWLGLKLRIIPEYRCQGVAEVIEARASSLDKLTFRSGILNTAVTATALGCGASAGREGPLVFMGGAISSTLGKHFGLSQREARTLLGCAAAAAVAAAFNAPIAGVLFALEVVLSNYALSVFGPVTLSSVISVLIARAHLGDLHRFDIPAYGLPGPYDLPLGIVLGIICGIVAWAFLSLAAQGRALARRLTDVRGVPAPLMPVFAGLVMGGVAMALPEVLGVGYEATSEAIAGNYSVGLLTVLLVAKLLATVLCLSCRFGTGVFSGGIYLGAISGAAFGMVLMQYLPDVSAGVPFYAMIGMGAVSGAIIGAPISTTLIVFELTGDYTMTATLMIAVGIATAFAQVFFGSSWFHHQLNQRGYDLSDGPQGVILQTIRVRDVMRPMTADAAPLEPDAPRLFATQTLGDALAMMQDLKLDGMPVVAERGADKIVGTVTQIRALRTYNTALVDSHIEHHR